MTAPHASGAGTVSVLLFIFFVPALFGGRGAGMKEKIFRRFSLAKIYRKFPLGTESKNEGAARCALTTGNAKPSPQPSAKSGRGSHCRAFLLLSQV